MGEYNESEDLRESEPMRKMFVGGLNRDTDDDRFLNYFSQFGTVVDNIVIKDPNTKTSRGFGFITYDTSSCVEAVFQARPHEIDGKTLDVKRAMPRDSNSSHAKVTKMFIGGISQDLTPEELQAYIEERHPTNYGTVHDITFIKDGDKNKGFGFLECSDHDFADRLTISEAKFMLGGKQMTLKKSEPKGGDGQQGGGRGGRGGGFGGRGGSRGRGGGRGGGGRGGQRGGRGGGYNNSSRGGYNQGGNSGGGYNNYNQGGGTYNQGYNQNGGGYGSYGNQGSYNQAYSNQQQSYGNYGQSQGYQQQSYGQNTNQSGGYGGNQGGNRYNPY